MRKGLTIAAALVLAPTAAFAHPGIGDAHGFMQGLAHPLGELDHILAMVAVGILAWQLGGRALWLVPGTFILVMAAGAALAMAANSLSLMGADELRVSTSCRAITNCIEGYSASFFRFSHNFS